ncbi:MAG: zinc-binding dehydrogenase [Clostridiales bacterium]|nr:zinc-binding dehydrogenase [Clostridiales bacterium]
MQKSIGANRTLDYKEVDYTRENIGYDYVYDLLYTKKLSQCISVANKNGHFIMLGGTTKNLFKVLVIGPILSQIWERNRMLERVIRSNSRE